MARAVSIGILRVSTTFATNWPCSPSMTDWKIFRSSSDRARNGLPMSLRSPDLIADAASPSFCMSPSAFMVTRITPMDPVTLVGCAMIVSAASAT